MRTLSTTFGCIFAAAAILIACGSFGEPAVSAPGPDGGGDAGSEVDAGAGDAAIEASVTADAANGPKPCAQRTGDLLCEDFEAANALGTWDPNLLNGGTVNVVLDATRSSNVLDARLGANSSRVNAQIVRGVSWTTPIFVRFYATLPDALADATYHILVVLTGIEIGIAGGKLVLNQFADPPFYASSNIPLATKKWVCIEWAAGATGTTLAVDGTQHVVVETKSSGPTDTFIVGVSHVESTSAARSILYDDVVVSTMPIGCN